MRGGGWADIVSKCQTKCNVLKPVSWIFLKEIILKESFYSLTFEYKDL